MQRIEEYFLPSVHTFYFPQDPVKAMTYVLDYVAWRAEELAKEDNRQVLPCFVIDGVENLAIHQPAVFDALIRMAKYYARTKKLRIVLVYSEGDVMSLVENTLNHRLVEVVEVGDLDDEDAERYLMKCSHGKMSDHFVKRLIDLIGGRILHLTFAADAYLQNSDCDEDVIFEIVQKRLYSIVAVSADNAVVDNAPVSEHIIKCITSKGPLYPSQLKKLIAVDQKGASSDKVQDAIANLVRANLLRYQGDGRVTWHNKFVISLYQ